MQLLGRSVESQVGDIIENDAKGYIDAARTALKSV